MVYTCFVLEAVRVLQDLAVLLEVDPVAVDIPRDKLRNWLQSIVR